ncbi:hypothetical protein WR25_12078 [Diploscapter pachys]|uniref:Uncharacterized protein n=1 Tax=Diploscapter pachys TaxID=2018661 RepID=A0A2A2M264_9BILA|nr:hypothetical protein WR25_12078 [Diploscapter pachys]
MRGDLFKDVVAVYGDLFTDKMLPPSFINEISFDEETHSKDESIENLEIMAKGLGEVLAERWSLFDEDCFNKVVDILLLYLKKQYHERCEMGADVRISCFSALLAIQCCPVTGFLQYYVARDESLQQNFYMKRRESKSSSTGFSWQRICGVVITALRQEQLWSVVSSVLKDLGRIIENVPLLMTLEPAQVCFEKLISYK